MAAWCIVTTALATLLPRVVVAATMLPIVVAMLKFIGIEDLWNCKLGTSLVLSVARGVSLGAFLTPLGGAPKPVGDEIRSRPRDAPRAPVD